MFNAIFQKFRQSSGRFSCLRRLALDGPRTALEPSPFQAHLFQSIPMLGAELGAHGAQLISRLQTQLEGVVHLLIDRIWNDDRVALLPLAAALEAAGLIPDDLAGVLLLALGIVSTLRPAPMLQRLPRVHQQLGLVVLGAHGVVVDVRQPTHHAVGHTAHYGTVLPELVTCDGADVGSLLHFESSEATWAKCTSGCVTGRPMAVSVCVRFPTNFSFPDAT